MQNTIHLFYPLKWDKTYGALGKTNAHFIAQKSWCKTNDLINHSFANPHNHFPGERKSQLTKTCSKLAIKTLE